MQQPEPLDGPAPGERAPATPRARAAADAVMALARAARSFALYDASNTVIRQLIDAYRARFQAALGEFGELALDVAPTEIAQAGEVVYRDGDREKSLAFKLFRDGMRRITIAPSAGWQELLTFLEVVALRYTAVRSQEEDAVTLLRKASLPSFRLVVVEGVALDEERPEPVAPDAGERGAGARPPDGWDTPLPRLPAPAPLEWKEVPEVAVRALRRDAEAPLPRVALGLARDLLAEAVRGAWPSPNRDLLAFFTELRDSFLAEGDLAGLQDLVDLVTQAGAGEAREELLAGLGNARTLDMVLDALPAGAVDLPPAGLALVPLLNLEAALDRLATEEDARRRALLVKVVLARLPRGADAVLVRLPALEPGLARAIASGFVARVPERALEVSRLLLEQRDEALRLEGLAALAAAPGEIPLGPVAALLGDGAERVRIRAAEILGRRGDERALEPIAKALESRDCSDAEAEALGRALAEISPIAAARTLSGWLQPKGRFLVGLSAQQKRLQWAAVAGLALLPGDEAERQLQALAAGAADDLRRHCLAALARRRKGPPHG